MLQSASAGGLNRTRMRTHRRSCNINRNLLSPRRVVQDASNRRRGRHGPSASKRPLSIERIACWRFVESGATHFGVPISVRAADQARSAADLGNVTAVGMVKLGHLPEQAADLGNVCGGGSLHDADCGGSSAAGTDVDQHEIRPEHGRPELGVGRHSAFAAPILYVVPVAARSTRSIGGGPAFVLADAAVLAPRGSSRDFVDK